MPLFQLDLTIQPETGLSIGGSGHTGSRADKTILRDGQNRPILPASQLKGRLRHACETLVRAAGVPICRPPNPERICPQAPARLDQYCPICQIFGSPWNPSPLQFRDLVQEFSELSTEAIRPGIGVERRRGIVQEGLLFLTETTAPGSGLVFRRDEAISGQLEAREQALLLWVGLQAIRNWGGAKSRGMGWATLEITATFDGQPLVLDEDGKEALATWLKLHIVSS